MISNGKILTRRGWTEPDCVVENDETPGLNWDTGTTEWTKILGIDTVFDADIYETGTCKWRVQTTHDHQWVDRNPADERLAWVATDVRLKNRAWVVAAPMADGEGINLTNDEAELMGWLVTDGGMSPSSYGFALYAWQTKPFGVARLAVLLSGKASWNGKGYRIKSGYARDLLARAGVTWVKSAPEMTSLMLRMSASQRAAMLIGVIGGDGTITNGRARIYQNVSPLGDAFALLGYLNGYRPNVRHRDPGVGFGGPRHGQPTQISMCRPVASTYRTERVLVGRGKVWQPVTGLGTWTAQFSSNPVLTGCSIPFS